MGVAAARGGSQTGVALFDLCDLPNGLLYEAATNLPSPSCSGQETALLEWVLLCGALKAGCQLMRFNAVGVS